MATSSNLACHFCQKQHSSHFCNCCDPPALFCLDCVAHHAAKYPRAIHQTIPIAALSQDPDLYRQRFQKLKKGSEELRRSLEQIDQCCSEFQALVKACIDYLTEYSHWWLQQVLAEKTLLAAAIAAAELETATCLDADTQPVSPLGQALWTLPSAELHVFRYSLHPPDLQGICASLATYDNSLQSLSQRYSASKNMPESLEPNQTLCLELPFVQIVGKRVRVFELSEQKWKLHPLNLPGFLFFSSSIDANWGMRYVWVEDELFCCGGGNSESETKKSAYLLRYREGWTGRKLPDMTTARRHHGLWWNARLGTVWALGGLNKDSPHHHDHCTL